mmetsp:Transcript_33138/g.80474  ORF Transcript_33138/g.80474 Transcript_33138/m.80474 type:complete len:435 (+) Transcript_33138:119-1423(+)
MNSTRMTNRNKGNDTKRSKATERRMVVLGFCLGLLAFTLRSLLVPLPSSSVHARTLLSKCGTCIPNLAIHNITEDEHMEEVPSIVILPGPPKTATTTVQACMAEWTVEGRGLLPDWSWPLPSHDEMKKLSPDEKKKLRPKFDLRAGAGFRQVVNRDIGRSNNTLSPLQELYRVSILESWAKGKKVVFGHEGFANVLLDFSWSRFIVEDILSMLPANESDFYDLTGFHRYLRPFDLQKDLEVVVNYRTPRVSHLRSMWHQKEAKDESFRGMSFREFLGVFRPEIRAGYFPIDSLGLAIKFLRYGLKTTIIDLSGMKKENRSDLCHVIACKIMKAPCTQSGRLATVPKTDLEIRRNERPDPSSGLNMTSEEMAKVEKIMFLYECGLKEELRAYENKKQLKVLFRQHGFLDGCASEATLHSFQWVHDEILKVVAGIN